MVPRTRTLANSAPAAWHDWHGAISSCVDHGHVSRNSLWFRSGNQEIREFLLTSFQSENPRIQWFQSEKFTMKSSWNPRYFPRAIPVVLMMSWTICRNLSGSASAPAGRIDGISWEYHGDIMGILWGDQGNFNIIQNSYIPISIYIYIHILTYIHIYIYVWNLMDKYRNDKAAIKPSHLPKLGLCHKSPNNRRLPKNMRWFLSQ